MSNSAVIRALSPALQSIPAAIYDVANDPESAQGVGSTRARTARQTAIMGAASVHEIIELIPFDFRPMLADPLNALVVLVTKLGNSRTTLAKWREHQQAGTFPQHLKGTAPSVQLTSEFVGSEAARSSKDAMDLAWSKFQQDSLAASIQAKRDEVSALEAEVAPEKVWQRLRAIVQSEGDPIIARSKLPVIATDEDGRQSIMGLEPSAAVIATRDFVLEDCGAYAARVISITESKLAQAALRIKKKKDLASAARVAAGDVDVEMGDSSTSAPAANSIKSMVEKAVSSALAKALPKAPSSNKRKREEPKANQQEAGKAEKKRKMAEAKVRPCLLSTARRTKAALGQVRPRIGKDQAGTPSVRPSSRSSTRLPMLVNQGNPGHQISARPSIRIGRFHSRTEPRSGFPRQQQGSRRKAGRSGGPQGAEQSQSGVGSTRRSAHSPAPLVSTGVSMNMGSNHHVKKCSLRTDIPVFSRRGLAISEGDLWVSNPSQMPDYLLELPLLEAIDEIVSRMSLEMISDLRYQQDVHQSPGVCLPKEISYQISVGSKYMFHQPANVELIRAAWSDFNRRLRWRIHHSFDRSGEEPYDPDYDVRPPSTKQAPALPLYIELGLVKGRLFCNEQIAKIPDVDTLRHPHKSRQPDVRSISEFLLNNDYVITGTDKNLGIAVSTRTWIVDKSQDILSDVNNYRCLEHGEAIKILDQKCADMEVIAKAAKKHIDHLEGTVSDFMRSKVTLRGESHHIPKFYGIPKIHKTPVKMRPIIPCHSAIMNPAAKYVSKKLKPLIEQAATVIHGSKDLAIKLSNLRIDTRRKWYILTGDVVAFYPNIPLVHCLNIVYDMYLEHYWNIRNHDDPLNRSIQELFKACLMVGNTQLLTQFQGKIYEQLNGLAMGVADSPDLANLYGYYFEKISKVLEHPDVPFYGRYIDDCFAIVYAETERQAVDLMSGLIKFDNCVITWESSDSHAPFLDMLLYKDVNDNTLQHMPYRKRGNHQERIPWISAHPYDVKRGTFLGEMSRLATLSSKPDHYSRALRSLVTLYISRGYPVDEVHKWLHSNVSKRWNSRLLVTPSQRDADVLVLKSQYNIAWNYFSSHQLGETVFGYWREWLNRADTGNFNSEYPAPNEKDLRVSDWQQHLPGTWDLRETSLLKSRIILSRKRTRNFLDISNLWKRTVLETLEDQTLNDIVSTSARYAASKRPSAPDDVNTQVAGPRLKRPREDIEEGEILESVARRDHSPTPGGSGWASAPMGSWGGGSRRL